MYIQEVIIDGFKSYSTRTVVGPFDPAFNAITGLNGSGKSNILDAICFVLGISNLSQVRVSNLQELVYKHGQAGITKATVTIVFNNANKQASPVGYEDQPLISVTRQVQIGGRNKYLINGHNAQLNRVQNLFHSVQLNVNNPHFLIMQGRITKVMNMKPPEILALIEEAAGTRMFETKKQSALKTIQKKDAKLQEIDTVLREEINPTLERLRSERSHYLRWTSNNAEIERLQRFCVAYRFASHEGRVEALEEEMQQIAGRMEEAAEEEAADKQAKKELERQMKQLEANRDKKAQEEVKALENELGELSKAVVKHNSVYSHKLEAVKAAEAQERALEQSKKEVEAAIEKKKEEIAQTHSRLTGKEQQHKRVDNELQAAQADATALASGSGSALQTKSLTASINECMRVASSKESECEQFRIRRSHLRSELAEKKKAFKECEGEFAKVTDAIAKEQRKIDNLRGRLSELPHDEAAASAVVGTLREKEQRLAHLSEQADTLQARLRAHRALNFEYKDPVRGFDRRQVHGVVCKLMKVKDDRAATALEVTAGAKLFNVVVRDEITATQLLKHGQLKQRVTIIPLNKIKGRDVPPQVCANARGLVGGDNVRTALSLVGHPEEVGAAMAHVFGGVLVCNDMKAAKAVTFARNILTRSVTFQGDSFDPNGVLTGGSRAHEGGVLTMLSQLGRVEEEMAELKKEVVVLKKQLGGMERAASEHTQLSNELQLAEHQLELLGTQQSSSQNYHDLQHMASLEQEIEHTDSELRRAAAEKEDAQREIRALEEQLRECENQQGKNQLKTLEKKIGQLKKTVATLKDEVEALRQEHDRLVIELEELQGEAETLANTAQENSEGLTTLRSEAAQLLDQTERKKRKYEATKQSLDELRSALVEQDAALGALDAQHKALAKKQTDREVEAKQMQHARQRNTKELSDTRSRLKEMVKKHPWISAEKESFGQAHTEYDFHNNNPKEMEKRLEAMTAEQEELSSRINKKVMSMFEKAEQEYQDLMQKKAIVEHDKAKIEGVIAELDQRKEEALATTYEKVNRDFGSIFSTLLPGTDAKLDPPEGCTFLDGLIVRVAFGGVWKQSLTELSGGQRSLLALSLVLSLLLFKPAPMYIMDEIDAALDLSHTQNIGQMIKTHFSQSQFVVVSLKEGMFNNANVLFRTRFVEGTSTVKRTTKPVALLKDAGSQPQEKENVHNALPASKRKRVAKA